MMKSEVQCKGTRYSRYIFALLLCFCIGFISSALKAQSFSNHPGVHIKDGTTIVESKNSDIKIHVVSGTKIAGFDKANISIIEIPSQKHIASGTKKIVSKQVSIENKKSIVAKNNQRTRETNQFILKSTDSGSLFLAYNRTSNSAIQTNTNNLQHQFVIIVDDANLSYPKKVKKTKILTEYTSFPKNNFNNILFVRPPPFCFINIG